MIAFQKKEHKFFDAYLDNDLDSLFDYLSLQQEKLLLNELVNIPEEVVSQYNKENGPTTQLGRYYNVFNFDNVNIHNLKNALNLLTKEACEYYNIDFEKSEFMIHGWYNLDGKTNKVVIDSGHGVNPLKNENFFHDHAEGLGAPIFHGYYCVNAEPSITYYKINGTELFENHNKNNRAIVSETGHPHGRDDWYEDKPRITIAYDIAPKTSHVVTENWITL